MFGPERILGLDIGASTIKIGEFQVSKTQGLRLTNFNFAELGLDPDHEENRKALIVATVRNLLREKGIKRSKVVFSVSGQSVFTRFVKLPPVDESKVVQIIQYEAQQNVPFPIDEVVWDYQLIGNNAQGELEVVLLAIKSNIIEELNEGVESAGLRTEKVDVAPMALYNAVRYNYGDLDGCTVVLDIGARTTNLLFIEQTKIFSRSIPIAGNAITQSIATEFNVPFLEAEQLKKTLGFVALGGAYEEPEDEKQARVSKIIRNVMTRLHAEVGRSVNFYRTQQGGSAPARVFLSGGSSILPYTDRFFKEKLQVAVEYFNPFRNIEVDPRVTREELARCAHFFGEVVGLGLRQLTECPIEVNLLPTSLRARRQTEQKLPYVAGAAAALLLVPLCWWGYTAKTATLHEKQLAAVRQQANELQNWKRQIENELAKLHEVKTKADQIVGLVDNRSLWPALLQDLNLRLVPNLWIISFVPQTASGAASGGGPTGVPAPMTHDRGGMPPMMGGGLPLPGAIPGEMRGTRETDKTALTEISIDGAGNHTPGTSGQDLQQVNKFADNLRASPYFDPAGVEITQPPNPMSDDPIFTFKLRVKLARPIRM